ncbi:MAG: hypothetical protein DGJ47_000857 [Rickettsiaceae bacterium]
MSKKYYDFEPLSISKITRLSLNSISPPLSPGQLNKLLSATQLNFLQIQYVDISHFFDELLDNLRNCPLTHLSLNRCFLNQDNIKKLAELIKSKPLKNMSLKLNNNINGNLQTLVESILTNPTIEDLNLYGIGFPDKLGHPIANLIKDPRCTIKTLNIGNNNLSENTLEMLAKALRHNKSITNLNLCWNKTKGKSTGDILNALKKNNTLQKLNLYNNEIGREEAYHLNKLVNTNLQILDLGSNPIEKEGAKFLSQALRSNSSLTHLDLSRTNLGAAGVKLLSESLSLNKSLIYLNLYHNNIGKKGAAYLGEALEKNKTLKTLLIHFNNLCEEGIEFIAKALQYNTSLTEIDLSSNNTTPYQHYHRDDQEIQQLQETLTNSADKISHSISQMLKFNNTLEILHLRENSLSGKNASIIAKGINNNYSLNKLCLQKNDISSEQLSEFITALSGHPMQKLDLSGNELNSEGAKIIRTLFTENQTLQELNLASNNIPVSDCLELIKELSRNRGIKQLNLCHNDLKPNELKELPPLLSQYFNVKTDIGKTPEGQGVTYLTPQKIEHCLKEDNHHRSVSINSGNNTSTEVYTIIIPNPRITKRPIIEENIIGDDTYLDANID